MYKNSNLQNNVLLWISCESFIKSNKIDGEKKIDLITNDEIKKFIESICNIIGYYKGK